MKNGIIAERYAGAILNVAKNSGEMEKILEDMGFLKNVLAENPLITRFLESPNVIEEDKIALIRKAFSSVLSVLTVNFILLLLRKYRLQYLKEIIDEYQRLFDQEMAIQRADVITALPLDEAMVERLHNTLVTVMEKRVALCFYVDPEIIGGVIVKTPNLVMDGSVRKHLKDLGNALIAFKV